MWFFNFLASRGYCSNIPPKLHKRIKKHGEIFFHYRINSYTYTSFNWIHDAFYKWDNENNKYVKIVPLNIEEFLTPLALAIWFMDDGSKINKSARIATNCFSFQEIEFLCDILFKKYNLKATPVKAGVNKGHILYIHTKSIHTFVTLIKPFMIKSLYYKLGNN